MPRSTAPALALLLPLTLCTTACESHSLVYHEPPPVVLEDRRTEDGRRVRYELRVGDTDSAGIVQTDTQTLDRAFLGVDVRDLDAERAAAAGVPAWRGAYVDSVVPGSAAEKAGLRSGDILRSLGPQDINAAEQVREVVQTELRPGVAVAVTVQSWNGLDAQRELVSRTLEVVPDARAVEQSRTQVHELPVSPGVRRHTGLLLAGIPPELSRAMFEQPEPVVMVTGVIAGSPGYTAGLRGGDRVLRVNEEPVTSREDVERAVTRRVAALGWGLRQDEIAGHGEWLDEPELEDPLTLSVDGPLGPHVCIVELEKDVKDDGHFSIPILFSYDSDVEHTDWAFLDFILQFGATYSGRDLPSATRNEARRVEFSMLPFGMFEFRSAPEGSESTFFWFITIRS